MGCLYKIDFPNGKSYIGFTTRTFEERIKGHVKAAKSGKRLLVHNAIRKFKFSFEAKILVIADDQNYLAELEARAISIYETLFPKGYNLTTGGEKSYAFSDSVKKKISAFMKGTKRRLGSKHTEESKSLMRKAKIGKKLSDRTKLAMSESRKRFYSCEENLSALKKERKSRNNSIQMSAMSALGWAKRKGIPFSSWKPKE
jgi:group I intron endonuclease